MPHALAGDSARHTEWLNSYPTPEVVRGPMTSAVMADLDNLDVSKVKGGRTYKQSALWLAGVIDKRGSEDGPSMTAKLAEQLTKVMQLLTKEGGESDADAFGQFSDAISTPKAG